jgi:CPA2 family monovalent cation:H+ antiporter-2
MNDSDSLPAPGFRHLRPEGHSMNELHAFLANFAMVLGVAAVTTVVFQRLRLPVLFGYMLAGLLIGPHIPIPLVADRAMVQALAELGVVLLMFSLGLEFTLRRLSRIGPAGGLVALLETSLMLWLGFATGRLFGWSVFESVLAGGMIAISSTTVIVRAFREQGVRGPVADLVFSVLIAEDLLAIVLLAVLTPVASGHSLSPGALLGTVVRFVGFLVAAVSIGVLLLPRVMRSVVALNRPETTVVASVGVCFGGALLAQRLGYSVALGAFLAGSLVAESGQSERIERSVGPIRDLFVAVFFVAVGMLVDPSLVARHWLAIAVFTVLVLLGKLGAVSVSAFLAGRGLQTSVRAGLSLAQIGEFSFILAGIGLASGAAGDFLPTVAVTVSALTTLLTPQLVRSAPTVAAGIDRRLPRPLQTFVALYGSWVENLGRRPALPAEAARVRRALRLLLLDAALLAALVIGVGVEGENSARWLAERTGLAGPVAHASVVTLSILLACPFALGAVRTSAALGHALAARAFPDLQRGRLDPAAAPRRAMVVTVQLAALLGVGVLLGAATQPVLPAPWGAGLLAASMIPMAVLFWRDAAHLGGHARAGAQVIVAAFERQVHVPAGATASSSAAAPDALARAYRLVPGLGSPVPVTLGPGSPAVGRKLGELELRGRTGATVLAIVRGEEVVLVPDGHQPLAEGDVLALAGTGESIEVATRVLSGEPSGTSD